MGLPISTLDRLHDMVTYQYIVLRLPEIINKMSEIRENAEGEKNPLTHCVLLFIAALQFSS